MKAARLYGPRDMRLEEIASPIPREGEALVRVCALGVCGSDVHYYLDGRMGDDVAPLPFTLGHEFAGEIVALGRGTEGPAVGTRVAIDPAIPCGSCETCLAGHPNCCSAVRFPASPPVHGALSELYTHPAHLCVPLPDSLSFEEGATLEPLGVAIHAVKLSKVNSGNTIAVLGGGPIGILIMQVALNAGASAVFLTEPILERRRLAQALGATNVCDPEALDPVDWIHKQTLGRGVDIAIEAAWGGKAVGQAVHMAKPSGRLVLVGIPREDQCVFPASVARRKGLSILMARRMKDVYPEAINLVEAGDVDVTSLITHRFPLNQAAEAFELVASLKDGICKAMISISTPC